MGGGVAAVLCRARQPGLRGGASGGRHGAQGARHGVRDDDLDGGRLVGGRATGRRAHTVTDDEWLKSVRKRTHDLADVVQGHEGRLVRMDERQTQIVERVRKLEAVAVVVVIYQKSQLLAVIGILLQPIAQLVLHLM